VRSGFARMDLSEVGHPIAGKQRREIMASSLRVGPSLGLGLIERGPQVFTRSLWPEAAVSLFSIGVLTPALARQGEIPKVPALD
jgi:hypothetical protein